MEVVVSVTAAPSWRRRCNSYAQQHTTRASTFTFLSQLFNRVFGLVLRSSQNWKDLKTMADIGINVFDAKSTSPLI
jgi:hypothetical protein